MSKNIVVFSDGTGQDGGVRPEQRVSNVYKLYRACRVSPETAISPKDQVTFYDAGLGTDVGATALTSPFRFLQKLLASITGRGITANIADCYEFIINHYEPGDRIFLIGFSRGAYTVRCVANLLMLCGIPTAVEGIPVHRFRAQIRDIADEAVNSVLEHGAGYPRSQFEDERDELAKRFRRKYQAGDDEQSNAAPHFIGVFDTVAALGAQGMRRFLIQSALATVLLTATAILAAVTSGILYGIFGTPFWWTGLGLFFGIGVLSTMLFRRRQRRLSTKTIRDFPNPGDVRSHIAEWKGENFDRLLSRHVHYARSANAIDETRKDFDRVAWGGTQKGVAGKVEGHERLIQLWFAGNHSDIGGSYSEVESRLSDIALEWMIRQATEIPNGLKIGPVCVNGEPLPKCGMHGPKLHLFPAADGVQHCEIAGTRDRLERLSPAFLRKFAQRLHWDEKIRDIKHDAPLHPTVDERFRVNTVPQCSGAGPYLPPALAQHEKFKSLYSSGSEPSLRSPSNQR